MHFLHIRRLQGSSFYAFFCVRSPWAVSFIIFCVCGAAVFKFFSGCRFLCILMCFASMGRNLLFIFYSRRASGEQLQCIFCIRGASIFVAEILFLQSQSFRRICFDADFCSRRASGGVAWIFFLQLCSLRRSPGDQIQYIICGEQLRCGCGVSWEKGNKEQQNNKRRNKGTQNHRSNETNNALQQVNKETQKQ